MPRSQSTSVRVEGIKPLLRRMKALPDRAQRRVLRPAVSKATTPIVKAARRLAPKGTGLTHDGRQRKSLRKAITKTRAKLHRPSGTVYVVAGAAREAPHAHLVHDGTEPHQIMLGSPLNLGTVVLPEGFVIQHPGSRPNPFLKNALDATQSQSQSILQKNIAEGIDKQARKLAKQK